MIFFFFIKIICIFASASTVLALRPFEKGGVNLWSTTYWKSDTVRFVFGDLNVGNSISIKSNAEVTPAGVYKYTASVPRAS